MPEAQENPVVVLSANTSWYLFNFRKKTIDRLVQAGCDVWCIAPQDAYSIELSKLGATYQDISMSPRGMRIWQEVLTFLQYRRALKKINPDVYLGFTSKCNIYGAFALWRTGCHVLNNISGLGSAFITGGPTLVFVRTL